MRRILFAFLILSAAGGVALAGGLFGPHGSFGGGTPQAIVSVTLGGGNSFVAGSPDGTQVGPISTVMSPPTPLFAGNYSIGGTNASAFRLSGSNLVTNGVQSAPSYSITLTATPTNLAISPFTTAPITITTPGQTVANINLSRTSFVGGAPSGTVVGAISTVMEPSSPAFSGTYSLSGTNAASFQVSGSNLITNGVLCGASPPCSYSVTITATSGTIPPFPKTFTITATPPAVVFLETTGSVLTWTVPADWTSGNNSIEAVGGGAGGGTTNGPDDAGGGGGGACSQMTNLTLTPSSSVSYRVGTGGAANSAGGDSWFNGATLGASSVGAKGGSSTANFTGGPGGQSSAGTGTVKRSGGAGGSATNVLNGGAGGGGAASCNGGDGQAGGPNTQDSGSGGGAAGGPLSRAGSDAGSSGSGAAAGGAGGIGPDGTAGGEGAINGLRVAGAGLRGSGGGGGARTSFSEGAAGGAGVEYDATHGPGAGGGGGGWLAGVGIGGAGGLYGGGGGGSSWQGASGGAGKQGLIKITYGGVAPVQTIVSVGLSPTNFVGGSPDGTQVGAITTVMSPASPAFSGTYSIVAGDTSLFRISGSNVLTNGVVPQGNYQITLKATPTNVAITPVTTLAIAIVGTGPAPQTIADVVLDNSQFPGGAGSAGMLIGRLSVAMNPAAPAFAGSLTQNNSNLTISNCSGSVCDLRVGAADLPGNTSYNTAVTATPTNGSIAPLTRSFTVTATGAASAALTTYTFVNSSGATLPAGSPVRFGQGFRRGDVPQGDCVRPRNSGTHANLAYDLFEIATRRENGDDNSIRHLVWWARTDAAVLNGATYTVEFVKTGAACPAQTPRTAAAMKARLVAASHALKITFTDVRNQDGSLRGVAGHNTLTFDVNSAFDNTGRDAPRSCGAGDVDDCWILSGAPKNDQGVADPMLYVQFYLDATSKADGTLGILTHSALVSSPWMNVAAGSVGNSGAPGPVGLPNDPQVVTYRPQLLDGATNQLDWSWWDQSIASTSNPITTGIAQNGGCADQGFVPGNGNWTFPGSVGLNAIQHGMAFFYHTNGAPPTGMPASGTLVYAEAVGNINASVFQPPSTITDLLKVVRFVQAPFGCALGTSGYNATTQGTGTQFFDFRVSHNHNSGFLTVDQNAADNVTAEDGTRTAWALYPALTPTEQMYWKTTGIVAPTRAPSGMQDTIEMSPDRAQHVYSPFGRGNQHFGAAAGIHHNLAQVGEYVSQAFLGGGKTLWDRAQIGSAAYFTAGISVLLNERTGRIPVLNNGRPGANHGGNGTQYSGLGAPFGAAGNGVSVIKADHGWAFGLIEPLDDVPFSSNSTGAYWAGSLGGIGTRLGGGNDHWGAFHSGIYQLWGRHRDVDANALNANRSIAMVYPSLGTIFKRQSMTLNGVTYYGLAQMAATEGRGDMNAARDRSLAAALGGDENPERTYFNDVLVENYWAQLAADKFIDGTATNFSSNFTSPWLLTLADPFVESYGMQFAYQGWAMLRDPLSKYFIDHYLQLYISACSDTDPTYPMPSFYCSSYTYVANARDAGAILAAGGVYAPNTGQYYVSNSSERRLASSYWLFTAGTGVTCQAPSTFDRGYFIRNGDKAKTDPFFLGDSPDEMNPALYYTVTQVENTGPGGSTNCLKIVNPATGQPFTGFTKGGVPLTSFSGLLSFQATGDGGGWSRKDYAAYVQPILYALKALGFSAINTAVNVMTQRSIADGHAGGSVDTGPTNTRQNWEPNIVVP